MMIESVPQTQEISFVLYLQILFCFIPFCFRIIDTYLRKLMFILSAFQDCVQIFLTFSWSTFSFGAKGTLE